MRLLLLTALLLCGVTVSAQLFNITDYGAVGNGTTLNTTAIQSAVDACYNAGGGTVLVPAGDFLTGTIRLKSGVNFYIAAGGTITGSTNLADYPDIIPLKRSYTDNYPQKSVFYAEGQHNISISGEGTFNGNGQSVNFLLNQSNRPLGFRFISCRNVRYSGLKLRHSGFWMMHNFDVDTLVLTNLNIINQGFGNNDGINIDGCRHVWVDSCFADCNDDPIVIKTTSLIGASDIEIKNCTVATYSRALKIGSETNGAIKNVYIHDCVVQQSTNGPLTTPASCGINLSIVDGGSMENVLVENVSMTGVNTPLFVRLGNRARKYADTAAAPGVGFVRNIALKHITATAATNITSSITGIPGYPLKNVSLEDVSITFPGGWAALDSSFTVPEKEPNKPDATIFGDTLPAAGLYLRHIDSIRLNRVCFYPVQPDGRPDLYLDDVSHADTTDYCLGTGISAWTTPDPITLFPNPTATRVQIDFPPAFTTGTLTVYNFMGQMMIAQPLAPSFALEVSTWAKGVYIVRAVSTQGTATRTFIKE